MTTRVYRMNKAHETRSEMRFMDESEIWRVSKLKAEMRWSKKEKRAERFIRMLDLRIFSCGIRRAFPKISEGESLALLRYWTAARRVGRV